MYAHMVAAATSGTRARTAPDTSIVSCVSVYSSLSISCGLDLPNVDLLQIAAVLPIAGKNPGRIKRQERDMNIALIVRPTSLLNMQTKLRYAVDRCWQGDCHRQAVSFRTGRCSARKSKAYSNPGLDAKRIQDS